MGALTSTSSAFSCSPITGSRRTQIISSFCRHKPKTRELHLLCTQRIRSKFLKWIFNRPKICKSGRVWLPLTELHSVKVVCLERCCS
ncbi:hypothetical protein L1987_63871 [Smallanthus sonchifolius]|uniref:Uncharacterized protein n=1 Tax=Smallanthus sonchifolius TaxID=185202 RepID=A0ACB9CEH1_9ASTR|nr:hypothetical protein L1987_63871 [Smallanthus sonchifolius]